jgi:hypothetical protein
MKHTNKFLLLLLLTVATFNVSAEVTVEDVLPSHIDEISNPRFQSKVFPGVSREPKKSSLVMQMVDTNSGDKSIYNLNSSLTATNNSFNRDKHFDDIEVTDNNIFQLKF